MLISSIILAISSSIDSLGIGITYGIKKTQISYSSSLILLCISFFISFISLCFGEILKNIFSESVVKNIGSIMLLLIGLLIILKSKENNKIKKKQSIFKTKSKKNSVSITPKIFFIINTIQSPIKCDLDKSNSIDYKEAIILGIALSLDSFCIGICGSIIGINCTFFPLFISLFQLIFFNLGILIGTKINNSCNLNDNILTYLSGIILFLIGIIKLLLL